MAEVTEKPKNEDSSAPAKTESKLELRPPRKLCCYSQRVCNLEILKGFDFCHKHILEDKASPFKPCDFVAKSNGRRCPNPAQKLPDRGKSFCIIHTRKAELRRAVEERRKRRHHDDNEGSYDDDKGKRRRTSSSNSQKSDKLDGHSSDEDGVGSGDDYLKVDSAWHGDIDSDADSVDSEEEDFLKHAGVWTVEEATRMCRDKMIRLRSLYISQFKRLQHVLKERRRKYCQAIQAEEVEETGECHLTPTQLLGRKPQHECPGTEALLHRQAKEKKQGGISTRQQGASTLRCTYSPGGNRCTEKVLPLTKHCVKHITHDPNQLLFQKCTFPPKGDSHCERNVAKIFTHSACRLHVELPTDMKRPNISNDLLDAKERAKLRKTRALESKVSEADVPEALQEKSSALVAPTTSGQPDESGPVTTEPPQQASASSLPSTQSSTPSISSEKMEVDNKIDEKIDVDVNKLSSNSVPTKASSSASSSGGTSGPVPRLALEGISPGLAAASLVAVCSSPQLPFQGTPLASVSSIPQSSVTDSKSLPSGSDKARSVSNAPSEASKVDVDSKAADVKAAADLKDINGSEAAKPKSTNTFLPGGNNTHAQAQRPVSPGKQPEQSKVVLNVTKLKQEAKVPASTSPPVSQTTAKAAPSHGTQKASSNTTSQNVTKIPPLESPEKPSQVISKSALQGTLPGIVHEPPKGTSHEPPKGTSQGTSPATPTIAKQIPLVTTGSSVHPPQSTTVSSSARQPLKIISAKPLVAIETGQPLKTVSTKPSTTSETTQPLKSTSAKPSITSETGQPLKSTSAKPSITSEMGQPFKTVSAKPSTASETGQLLKTTSVKPSPASETGQLLKTTSVKPSITSETGQPLKTISAKPSITSEMGQPLKSISAKPSITNEMGQPLKSISAKPSITSEMGQPLKSISAKPSITSETGQPLKSISAKPSTTSETGQPLKSISTKPSITSEMHRSAPVKSFQHLPAGMTAASSKQFRAITSVTSKDTTKDSKTDPAKSQEHGGSTKLT